MAHSPNSDSPTFLGWITIAVGLFPVARGLRLLPAKSGDAPDWVILLCGLVFILAGAMLMVKESNTQINNLLAALLTATMGAVGVWVAILSPDEGMSGGIPFLAHEYNLLIARCIFGFGAALSFLLCYYAFTQLSKK